MGIKIRKHGTVIASFATPQEIVIDAANDSIAAVQSGAWTVDVSDAFALAATQTDGTQRTKITDGADNVGVSTVGGAKALKVDVVQTTEGVSPSVHVDDTAFDVGVESFMAVGAMADETAPDSVDEGDVGVLRMTLDRLLKIQLAGVATGVAVPITDNAGSITVDGTFWQATQPVSAASLPLPTGAATEATLATLATQATLAAMSAKLPASLGAKTGANSLSIVPATDASFAVTGTFWQATQPVSAASLPLPTGAATEATLTSIKTAVETIDNAIAGTEMQVDVLTMPDTTVIGKAAHDAAVSGNPVRIAGRAMLANGTAVAEDDTADIATDNQGRIINTLHVPRDLTVHGTATLTNTTETTIISAGAAGVFHDVVKIVITNSSSTAVRVAVKDATGGTTRIELALAANGGAVVDFGTVPLTQAAAANNWTVTASGSVTSLYCFAQAIKRIA